MMDGMCQMPGGVVCGWGMLLTWFLVLMVILALVLAIVTLVHRGGRGH
jgi:hypothetical protein